MSAFEDIRLSWNGREYTIRANQVMSAIALIENHVTFTELTRYAERETAPIAKLAQAFASVLRLAGGQVSDEEVYEGMFATGGNPGDIMAAITTLLALFIPKSALTARGTEESGRGKKRKPAAARSSKRRTKPRSAKRKS